MWITPRFPRGSGSPPSLTDDRNETRTQAESMASPVSPIMQPISVEELERKAKSKLKPEAFDYLAGGAGAEETMRANREALRRWRIVPRFLRNVARRDLGVDILGQRLPAPLMLAPIGVQSIFHKEAELAVARATRALGIPFIFNDQKRG